MKPSRLSKLLKPTLQAVPLAALMLGAAEAGTTVGLNFQSWYYDSGTNPQTVGYGNGYQTTGFPVTAKAFGLAVADWVNTDPIDISTPPTALSVPFAGLTTAVTATNLWESNFTGPGTQVAGWPAGSVVQAAMTPGNYEVLWSFLDNTGWNVSMAGLNAKFPSGYVVGLIGGCGKTTANSSVSITENTGSTLVGTVTFSLITDNAGLGVSPVLANDSITLTNASRPASTNCALAGIIVTDQPVVTKDPVGGIFTAGTNFTLTPISIGLPTGLTYQWRLGGVDIAGATSATYTKVGAGAGDAGNYDLVVTNAYGTTTSGVAVVAIPPATPFVWKGNIDGNWDIATTANWTVSGGASTYTAGGTVEFDDTATTGNVTITAAVSPSSMTVTNSTKAYAIGGGAISGATGIVKNGSNDLTLTGVNTFTGNVTLNAGSLTVGGAGQLGAGAYPGLITDNGSLVFNSSAAQTLSGVISGTGNLVKNGAGSLTLSANETFAGTVQVDGGTLALSSPSYFRTFSPTSSITVNSGAFLQVNGLNVLHGDGAFYTPVTVNGGTITMNAYHSHFGPLTLNGGTVNGIYVGGFNGEYSTIDAGVTVGGSATSTFTRTGSSGYSLNSANTFTVAATGDPSGNDLMVAAPFIGSGSLVKAGAGKMVLSAVNTYAGPTTVNAGTLEVTGEVAGGATVNSATLTGTGMIAGASTVNSGGVLRPSVIEDDFRFNSTLALAAGSSCEMDIDKAVDNTMTSDLVWVASTVTYGGTLKVTATGTTLANGDTVKLFDAGSYLGTFSNYDLPALAPGLNWNTGNLTVDGTLTVSSIVSTPVITPGTGGYVGTVNATISSDSGSTIHYTLDGSDPLVSGTVITASSPVTGIIIPVSSTVTVKAYATKSGLGDSATATATLNTQSDAVWTAADGSWSDAPNWLNNVVPNNVGDPAKFDTLTLAASTSVTVSGAETVGSISFGDIGNAFDWTVSGSGSLILDNGASSPVVNVDNRTASLTVPVTGTNGFTKSGGGILAFPTRKTYTGDTIINNGILDLTGGGNDIGTIRGTVTVNTGGTLRISTADATGYAGGATAVTLINLTGGTLNVNSINNQTLGSAVINMTGGSITGITGNPPPSTTGISNLDFFGGASALNTLASATTSTISGGSIRMRQINGVVFNVADGAAAIDLDISSMLRSVTSLANDDLVKAGAGTMRLSGVSIMANSLVVNAGAVELSNTGSFRFTLGNTTTNKITGPGTATLDGAFEIVSTAVTNTTGSWTLVDVATKSYGGSFTLGAGWANAAGVWTKTDGTKAWTFTQSSGVLSLAVVTGYSSWINGFVGLSDTTSAGDPDSDGMKNALEYVLNGNPGASDSSILPGLAASGANFVFTFTRRVESANDTTQVFQYGTTLSGWTNVNITGTAGAEVSLGTPAGGLQTVTITIPKGANTQLFGRLSVTQP